MTPEQQAAERLRNDSYEKDAAGDYTDSGWSMRGCDESEVASLYLAEHRPDDSLPVTAERVALWGAEVVDALFILSGPDSPMDLDTHFVRFMFDVFDKTKLFRWSVNGIRCVGHPTCGDVRHLCRALGIPLTEQETAT